MNKFFVIGLLVVAVLLLAGCIQPKPPACGNGICEPGEETFCASDCEKIHLDVNGILKEAEVKGGVITVGDVQARIRDNIFINDSKMYVLSESNETRKIAKIVATIETNFKCLDEQHTPLRDSWIYFSESVSVTNSSSTLNIVKA